MYIWIGCKLPSDFETAVRRYCLAANKNIELDTVAFSLPQHVSLKISFQSEHYREIIEFLTAYLKTQPSFSLRIQTAEQNGHILWLPVENSLHLRLLHEQLDAQLEQRFGIPQHEFDKCFLFHSTLFMDPDADKISRMHQRLQSFSVAQELSVDTFLLGLSETGKPGKYSIVREIKV